MYTYNLLVSWSREAKETTTTTDDAIVVLRLLGPGAAVPSLVLLSFADRSTPAKIATGVSKRIWLTHRRWDGLMEMQLSTQGRQRRGFQTIR